MSRQSIIELPGLENGGELTEGQVAAELGIKLLNARGQLSRLVQMEKLTRIPGIASTPARYRLKTPSTPFAHK